MAFTLADRVQYMDSDDAKGITSVIFNEMAGGSNNILKVAPINTVDEGQGSLRTIEDEGPSTQINSRPLYGAYNEGTPSYRNRGWKTGNYGSRAMVDEYLMMQRNGEALMIDAMKRKGQALNRKVNNDFINGDTATSPNGTDGIKKWLVSTNVLPMTTFGSYTNGCNITSGNTSTLAADQRAVLEALDEGCNYIGGREHPNVYIACNHQFKRVVNKAIRELGWFGTASSYYDKQTQDFGGYKFLIAGSKNPVKTHPDAINDTNSIIPNNFTIGTNTKTTEVWFVRFGVDDGVSLNQLRDIKVEDLGRIISAPVYVKEISWYLGTYAANDFCIAKLTGVQAIP